MKLVVESLQNAYFRLRDLTKFEVREIAEKNNFINHDKKDSVGICFVGERNLKDFLKRFIQFESGNIKDSEGNILGSSSRSTSFHSRTKARFKCWRCQR